MATSFSESACRTYIRSQGLLHQGGGLEAVRAPRPFITLSRQSGAGGLTTVQKLTAYLNEKLEPDSTCPWTAFDGELIDTCLAEHHLPESFAKYLEEDKASAMSEMLDELFNVHPSRSRLVRRVSETILHLAHLGHCIIVGRGAAVVTQRLPWRVSVRLVGSPKRRIAHLMEYYGKTHQEAEAFMLREDRRREAYVREYLNHDITDPLLYHLIINTDEVSYEETAHLIADLVRARRACAAEAMLA